MPNIKSAIKRMRQSAKKRVANRSQRSAYRTEIKKVRTFISEGNLESLATQLPLTVSSLDKSANKGLMHKNKAARHISRLMRQANAVRVAKSAS